MGDRKIKEGFLFVWYCCYCCFGYSIFLYFLAFYVFISHWVLSKYLHSYFVFANGSLHVLYYMYLYFFDIMCPVYLYTLSIHIIYFVSFNGVDMFSFFTMPEANYEYSDLSWYQTWYTNTYITLSEVVNFWCLLYHPVLLILLG